jgi:hypothetical protein
VFAAIATEDPPLFEQLAESAPKAPGGV